jgi:hypothetical protein
MNKFQLIQEIHNKDVYKDDMKVMAYNSKGQLTDNVKISTKYTPDGTELLIIGEDENV